MLWTVHTLKVDQTVLACDGGSYIFISNINVPVAYLNQKQDIFARIYNFIQSEYVGCARVQYQVTSTYELRNTVDGSIRQWTGSFSPRNNLQGSLTPFEYFDDSFIGNVAAATDVNSVLQKLKFTNATTTYVFERLTSIIINVQAVVPTHFATLTRRNLVNNGRHSRSHNTIELP